MNEKDGTVYHTLKIHSVNKILITQGYNMLFRDFFLETASEGLFIAKTASEGNFMPKIVPQTSIYREIFPQKILT